MLGLTLHASLIRVPETPSAFHPHAQCNAFRRRDVRQQSRSFAPLHCCNFWLAKGERSLSRYRIVNRNWVISFGIFVVLVCCTPTRLKSGDGIWRKTTSPFRDYDTERVFDKMIEQRDIKMAIRTLVGEGFTSGEIERPFEID